MYARSGIRETRAQTVTMSLQQGLFRPNVAIVAGAGDRVEQMQHAEASGAAAYITGEINSRIDTEYGHRKFADVERFAAANPDNRSICPSRSPRTHISAFAES
ncbi:MAG: hypothetical protein WKF55_03155 [Gemmatimonadaceae bacterium]